MGCGTTLLIGFGLWLAGTIFIVLQPDRISSSGPDAGAILISFGLLPLFLYSGIAFAALVTAWRVRKDGSRFWAQLVVSTLNDQHG